jgi:hypothetical protein
MQACQIDWLRRWPAPAEADEDPRQLARAIMGLLQSGIEAAEGTRNAEALPWSPLAGHIIEAEPAASRGLSSAEATAPKLTAAAEPAEGELIPVGGTGAGVRLVGRDRNGVELWEIVTAAGTRYDVERTKAAAIAHCRKAQARVNIRHERNRTMTTLALDRVMATNAGS